MKPEREQVLRLVAAGKLSRGKAARQLGLSRQYIGKIVKEMTMKPAAAPAPAPVISPAIPLSPPPAPSPEAPSAPVAPGAPKPKTLQDLLREMNGGGPAAAPGAAPAGLPPPPSAPAEYDREDAEAGAELFEMARGGVSTYIGTRIYGLKPEDPRLDALRTPNKFLARAVKRNEAKAAVVGKLTGGWLGLAIGTGAEVLRALLHFAGLGLNPVIAPPLVPPPPKSAAAAAEADAEEEGTPTETGGFSISEAKREAEERR